MSKSKILVLITGSIAAYKACYLISKLSQNGFEVKCAISNSALNFIGATSIEALSGNVPVSDTFETGHALDHIYLMRWADLIITIPATGNYINKIAAGIGDDLITTMTMAHDYSKPFLIAPAMNTQMYQNPITSNAINKLKQYGFNILETASGVLACNEIGSGKLLDPDLIYDEIINALSIENNIVQTINPTKKNIKVLITSGGTIENIDNVRAITNTSSGKTGATIANALFDLGFDIDFLTSKTGQLPLIDCDKYYFTDFKSINNEIANLLENNSYDIIIHAAAISDYSIEGVYINDNKINNNGKISSDNNEINIKLVKNPKIINKLKQLSPDSLIFGFKLNDKNDDINQLIKKQFYNANIDYIVQNSTDDINIDKNIHKYNIYNNEIKIIQTIQGTYNLGSYIGSLYMGQIK